MKKKVCGWMNLLLGWCIVWLGFGSCRSTKQVVIDEPIPPQPVGVDTFFIPRPPIEPPKTIYGPPSMMMREKPVLEEQK